MTNIKLYIADTHFGHANVIKFDNRPFENIGQMDKMMIELWNARVSKDDEVYIVGDFAYRNEQTEEWYLEKLKGRKNLIIGNHDAKLLKNDKAMSYFETVDKMVHVSDEGHQICLCHFPIAEWNGYRKGALHIYGHIHSGSEEIKKFMDSTERAYNAGCMLHGYMPVTLKELIINKKR